MKKNKVIFFPDSNAYKYFYKEKNIYFFNETGWWIFNGKLRVNISVSPYNQKFQYFNIVKIIDALRFWGPMWARMIGAGDHQELVLRKSALLIHAISIDLKKFNITTAYFMTSLTHHVDSLIFDFACSSSKVKKVFLYREVISARLIPFIQKDDLPSRFFLNKTISSYKYNDALDYFIENKKQDMPPKTSDVNIKYNSFISALFICFFKDIRFILITIKSFFKPSNKRIFDFIYKTYPFQFTSQLIRAKLALDFYASNQVQIDELFSYQKKDGPVLLITAHLQPEASSFPEGHHFSNHIDIVIELRKKGYSKKIFYKEHPDSFAYIMDKGPTCVGIFRDIDYYKQLLNLGCVFVPQDFNLSVNSKYNNHYLPVTISGTIGLERSLFGYHTIVAGYPWYQKQLPGILSLDKIKSLKTIKSNWMRRSHNKANSTYQFMLDKLNGKTIVNGSGIAGYRVNELTIMSYLNEFKRLIKIT